ncbi:MAG: septum formation initiator family protein [Rickettsiales bacterium]
MTRRIGAFLGIFVVFYLGFHTVGGVFSLFQEKTRLEEMKETLSLVQEEKTAMDKKVKALSDKSLDLDLLDERVKTVLGMAGKNEVVVFTK